VTYAASAIGGRVWQDKGRLGQVMNAAFKTSRLPTALALIPILAMLAWLLHQNGAPPFAVAVMMVLIACGAGFQLRTAILVTVPRLRGEFRLLQKVDLALTITRLALIAGAALIYLDASIAILLTVMGSLGQWLFVRKWVAHTVDMTLPADPDMEMEMRRTVKRQWLNDAYYAFYGQISVFLLSIVGTPESVADLGALGRLGTIFVALGATMQSVILPVYARCQDPRRLRQLYVQILAANFAIALAPVAFVFVAPAPFLWLLGAKYAHLSHELLLISIGAATSVVASILALMNQVRAWIVPGWITVPVGVATQIVLIVVIGPTSLDRVIWMSILSNFSFAVLSAVTTIVFSRRFALAAKAGG
jgi:O-antigen/teichoic acid export membrane protein